MFTLGIYGIVEPESSKLDEVHDHSIALMNNGEIIEFIQLERLTKKKYDNRLDVFIEDIAKKIGILNQPLRIIYVDSFIDNCFISQNKNIILKPIKNNYSIEYLNRAKGLFFGKEVETWICSHELAHIGSHLPFFGKYLNNSLLVHIDAGASKSNCSVWHFIDNNIKHIHHSWELHTVAKNFCCNPLMQSIINDRSELSLAGKLMGYSGYGVFDPKLTNWLKIHNWFQDTNIELFFHLAQRDLNFMKKTFDLKEKLYMNIAASAQYELERQVFNFIRFYKEKTKAEYLYLSGGTALNIIMNSKIENSNKFRKIYIPPCCNDTGLALGAASLLEFFNNSQIKKHSPFLNSFSIEPYIYNPNFNVEAVIEKLVNGEIIAICVGKGEVGPRALGHRSLLAIPTSREIRDKLSITMKGREWYRPVAPIVLKSLSNNLFEIKDHTNLANYMLGNYKVHTNVKHKIPGVVHADGTARVQVVDENNKTNELIINILKNIYKKYKIPCLINTSFNCKGSPIVHTREDAIYEAKLLNVNYLIYNNELIKI